MAASPMSEVMQHLRRAVFQPKGPGLTDGQLLGCFVERRDGAAFAALVRRHGPMVWGVCRRLLNQQDAEDAFQATFLVLVRKAASVVPRERIANWLYGVAHQTALQARRNVGRRRAREKQVTEMPEPAVAEQDLWADLQPLLDQELSRLPDAYREVIVLSDLEGKTRKEVARQLGLPEGTVGSRLARARAMLAKRLARRGVALSGGALAAVLSQQAAPAGLPNSVVDATIKAASLLAAGKATAGLIPAKVVALTEGGLKAMLLSKLKVVTAVVTLAVLACAIGGMSMRQGQALAGNEGQIDKGGAVPPKPKTEEWVEIAPPFITVVEEKVETGKANTITFPATVVKVYADAWSITVRERTRTHIDIGGETPNVKVTPIGKTDHRIGGVYETVLQHLGVSPKAKISSGGKEIKLADLKSDTDVKLQLTVDPDGRLLVIGIEAVGKDSPYKGRKGEDPDKGRKGPAARETPPPKPEPAKGLKLTLSADKTETRMDPGADYGARPVKLKLTFTNTGDKPIKLDAHNLPFRIQFHCHGPSPDSVKRELEYVDVALKSPTEEDHPVLQPGKSWSPTRTPSFPGDIPDGDGTIAAYYLRKPGTYKLRMTLYDKYAPHVEGAEEGTKWLESNELELKVREKE
jgi:RNA polymerase sigma factor (sigma-70 family)